MNELILLMETIAGLTWVFGCVALALAAGFLIFDRPATREEEAPELRRAA